MPHITVTLPDGSQKQVESGSPVLSVAAAISPRLAEAALAAWVDGRMVDLDHPLTADASVRIVTTKSPEALELYRHSTAHLMAAAVTALFPNVQCGIGPAIEDGFFYDFVVERPFVPEDLEAIEKKMAELAKNTPSVANIKAYAQIIRERATLRQLIGISSDIARKWQARRSRCE